MTAEKVSPLDALEQKVIMLEKHATEQMKMIKMQAAAIRKVAEELRIALPHVSFGDENV